MGPVGILALGVILLAIVQAIQLGPRSSAIVRRTMLLLILLMVVIVAIFAWVAE
jgi:hypothetical protein